MKDIRHLRTISCAIWQNFRIVLFWFIQVRIKECSRVPRLRNPVSRMPKELMRNAVLKTKEKSYDISETHGSIYCQESPIGYADQKVESAEGRVIDASVRAVSTARRIMVKKSYEKLRGYRQEQPATEDVRENREKCVGNSVSENVNDSAKYRVIKEKVREKKIQEKSDSHALSDKVCLFHRDMDYEMLFGDQESKPQKTESEQNAIGADRIKAKTRQDQAANTRNIKIRETQSEMLHPNFKVDSCKSVKHIFHNMDGAVLHEDKIWTGFAVKSQKQAIRTSMPQKNISIATPKKGIASAVMPKRQAGYTARASRQMAVKSARAAGEAAQSVKKTAKIAVKGITAAIKAAVSSTKALTALAAAGGGLAIFLILATGVIGGVLLSGNSQSTELLSQEVMDYTPVIQRYAQQYGIPDYVQVIQAIMMQESRGQGNDPMQASECPFNTRYGNSPNAITDPEYSIQVGIQYYAYCVQEAGCMNPQDLDKLKLSIQGYNYGNGYISWALWNHGGYSETNALQFS